MFSLKDKVALLTGASQGIGRETALALAEAGAKVVAAARNEEKLAALVSEIIAAGGQAMALKMDVADPEQVKSGFKQTLEKFARLDILVNNAAITRDGLALRMKQEDWDAVIRTNLTGAHLCIQQALSTMMRARTGRIINIASVVAQMGNAGQANYVRQSRLGRPDQSHRHRDGLPQYHRKRRRPRLHRHTHDGPPFRQSERRAEKSHPSGTHGHGPRGSLFNYLFSK